MQGGDIVIKKKKRYSSFFYAQNYAQKSGKRLEETSCVQELHWHVQNVNRETTILQKIRRHIRTGWKSESIADSAELIQYTKKPNNPVGV